MSDAPAPIPTDGVWMGGADAPNWGAMPQRNRRRRRRGSYPVWLKYLGWCVGLAALLIIAQIAVHAVRSDPRDARVFSERELRLSALHPNERVLAEVSVWQRPAVDYFRPTRGLLVLTDAVGDSAHPVGGRLIYLGLQPRDPLSPPESPPTFDQRDWPVDTMAMVGAARTFMWLSRALRISTPSGSLTLGVPSGASGDADRLLAAVSTKYKQLRVVGWQRREARRANDRARLVDLHNGRREWFHRVRRGEALASVARLFGTTPDAVRALNGITGDRIRVGQLLKVKGLTKNAVPFPANVRPDSVSP